MLAIMKAGNRSLLDTPMSSKYMNGNFPKCNSYNVKGLR